MHYESYVKKYPTNIIINEFLYVIHVQSWTQVLSDGNWWFFGLPITASFSVVFPIIGSASFVSIFMPILWSVSVSFLARFVRNFVSGVPMIPILVPMLFGVTPLLIPFPMMSTVLWRFFIIILTFGHSWRPRLIVPFVLVDIFITFIRLKLFFTSWTSLTAPGMYFSVRRKILFFGNIIWRIIRSRFRHIAVLSGHIFGKHFHLLCYHFSKYFDLRLFICVDTTILSSAPFEIAFLGKKFQVWSRLSITWGFPGTFNQMRINPPAREFSLTWTLLKCISFLRMDVNVIAVISKVFAVVDYDGDLAYNISVNSGFFSCNWLVNSYSGVFVVDDDDSEARFKKLKMADPIWRLCTRNSINFEFSGCD